MTYREPIAPNPEPSEPEPKEPFDWYCVRRAFAWCVLVVAALSPVPLIAFGLRFNNVNLYMPGFILGGIELVALVVWAGIEVTE